MIEFLKRLLKKDGPTSEDIVQEESKSIYDKLAKLREMALSKNYVLDGSRHGTGKVACHHDSIVELNKTLREVNGVLKNKVHLDEQLFSLSPLKEVYFESFLISHKGIFLSDPKSELDTALRLIGEYVNYMKGADKIEYGYMEYNHRRLYSFTIFLIKLLNVTITGYAK